MSVSKVNCWQAGDGKQFMSEREAVEHDRNIDFKESLRDILTLFDIEDVKNDRLADDILEIFDVIRKAG